MTSTTYKWNKQDKFARVNEDYERGLGGLTPCAKLLHHWLVRGGKPLALFEINLFDFQNSSENYRADKKGGFCLRWIQKALKELINKCLVIIEHRYNNKEFKIKVRRPTDAYFSSPVTFADDTSVTEEDSLQQDTENTLNVTEESCATEEKNTEQYIEQGNDTKEPNNCSFNSNSIGEVLKNLHIKNGKFSSQNGNESSENSNKNSKKEGSNDANSSIPNRYKKITTDKQDPPSDHPVVVTSDNSSSNTKNEPPKSNSSDDQEKVDTNVPSHEQMKKVKNTLDEINKPSIKVKTPQIPDDFVNECRDAKIHLHAKLMAKMREFTMRVLKNALAVVKEQMSSGREVRNPTGLFVQAMTNEWKPTTIKQDVEMRYGIEFHNWYQKAIEAGVVEDLPINCLPIIMNKPMVRIPNPEGSIPPYEVISWIDARELYGDFEE